MSQSTTLKDIGRSMTLGFLADDVVAVLEASEGSLSDDDKEVLETAKEFLEGAKRGYNIVEEAHGLTDGIAAAVDQSRRYRQAERTLDMIDQDRDNEIEEYLRSLISDITGLLKGRDTEIGRLHNFFDALARVTLSSTSHSLEQYANQRYEPRMRAW